MNLYGTSQGEATQLNAPQDDSGKLLPVGRIKDVAAARSIWTKVKQDDDKAARDRAMVHAMVNGAPPYSRSMMARTGRKDECNVNWGIAFDLFEEAKAPYIDMIQSPQQLLNVPLKNGPIQLKPQDKATAERIIATAFTNMVRGWEDFYPRCQYLVNNYLLDGLLTGYFQDTIDWRPQFVGLDNWKFPRRTRASVNEIDVCCIYQEMQLSDLYAHVANKEDATKKGWNIPVVEAAIKQASTPSNYDPSQPERVEEMMKSNDIAISVNSPVIKAVFVFVKELNGKVSQYIFTEQPTTMDSGEPDSYLFKAEAKYDSMSQAFTPFSDGVGTNGFYHSVRGYMHRLFSIVTSLNRLRCSFYDLAKFESTPRLKAENEEAINERAMLPWGPFIVMTTVEEAERQPIDFQKTLMPAIEDISNLLTSASRRHSPRLQQQDADPRMSAIEALSKISLNAQNLFYAAWSPLLRQMLKRACNPDYVKTDPGAEHVLNFIEELQGNGIDPALLQQIDFRKVTAVRAIGNGSAVARKLIYGELSVLKSEMDEEGRNFLNRETASDLVGPERADYYFPVQQGMRPPQDQTNAEFENQLMRLGQPVVTFKPNDNHAIHIGEHITFMNDVIASLPNASQQTEWTALVNALVEAHTHAVRDHMAALPATAPELNGFKKELKRIGELVYNATKHLQNLEAQAAQGQNGNGAPSDQPGGESTAGIQTPGGSIPDTLFRKIVESNALSDKLAYQKARDRQALEAARQKHQQEMEFDSEIKRRKLEEKMIDSMP